MILPAVMARHRIQYPGAVYHVMNRGSLLDFILGTHPITTKGTTQVGRSEATKRL